MNKLFMFFYSKFNINYTNKIFFITLIFILTTCHNVFSLISYVKDPKNSLNYFFDKLTILEAKPDKEKVRIIFFGTSSIGFDRVTSQMRKSLQDKFGDGGKGFIVIKKGSKYFRHQDIEWEYKNWIARSVTKNKIPNGKYGLGGVLSYNKRKAYTKFKTIPIPDDSSSEEFVPGTKFSKFTILYQSFPNGGEFELKFDSDKTYKVATNNESIKDKAYNVFLEDAPHEVEILTSKKTVKIYGAIFERDTGLVIDASMMVGAKARTWLNYDKNHIQNHIKYRNPDLLIFQFGDNDFKSTRTQKSINKFISDYTKAINMLWASKAEASCLIISIKDRGYKRGKKIITNPKVPIIVDATKKVAANTGCAFFNIYEAMGGKGVMAKWRNQDPPLVSKDYGHLLNRGAKIIGKIITNMLLESYENYKTDD